MTNPTSDPRDTTVDEILTKHITDFNIRDSGGMEDGRNVRLCNTEAKTALDAHYQAKFEKDMSDMLDRIEQSVNQHTVPEGVGLVTRSYVRNTLNYERKKGCKV